MEKSRTLQELPEDTLRLILSHIDENSDLKDASIVCKLWCTILSSQVHKISLSDHPVTLHYQDIVKMLKRFPYIKELSIHRHRIDDAMIAVSESGLKHLEKLHVFMIDVFMCFGQYAMFMAMSNSEVIRRIKSFKPICYDRPDEEYYILLVIPFISRFRSLTELDFSHSLRWTDDGINRVTRKLPSLQKINLGNNSNITDETLDILSSNCPKLESLNLQDCTFSVEALYKFLCKNPQLRSVDLPGYFLDPIKNTPRMVERIHSIKNVSDICIAYNDNVHDTMLIALAESHLMLKNLKIGAKEFSYHYTMEGLSKLLYASPELESLTVHLPMQYGDNDHDKEMSKIVERLPCLHHIKVVSKVMFHATLFSLVQNCTLLESICIERDVKSKLLSLELAGCTIKNYSIRSVEINVNMSPDVSQLIRKAVESCCPKLKTYVCREK